MRFCTLIDRRAAQTAGAHLASSDHLKKILKARKSAKLKGEDEEGRNYQIPHFVFVSNIFKALPFQANKLRHKRQVGSCFPDCAAAAEFTENQYSKYGQNTPKGQDSKVEKFYVSCSCCSSSCSCTRVPARPARLHVSFATISTSAFDCIRTGTLMLSSS